MQSGAQRVRGGKVSKPRTRASSRARSVEAPRVSDAVLPHDDDDDEEVDSPALLTPRLEIENLSPSILQSSSSMISSASSHANSAALAIASAQSASLLNESLHEHKSPAASVDDVKQGPMCDKTMIDLVQAYSLSPEVFNFIDENGNVVKPRVFAEALCLVCKHPARLHSNPATPASVVNVPRSASASSHVGLSSIASSHSHDSKFSNRSADFSLAKARVLIIKEGRAVASKLANEFKKSDFDWTIALDMLECHLSAVAEEARSHWALSLPELFSHQVGDTRSQIVAKKIGVLSGNIMSWSEARRLFLDLYQRVNHESKVLRELLNLKQNDDQFSVYASNYERLMSQVNRSVDSNGDLLHFIDNLKPYLRYLLNDRIALKKHDAKSDGRTFHLTYDWVCDAAIFGEQCRDLSRQDKDKDGKGSKSHDSNSEKPQGGDRSNGRHDKKKYGDRVAKQNDNSSNTSRKDGKSSNQSSTSSKAQDNQPQTCLNCGDSGHHTRACTKPRRCYNCKSTSHVRKDCDKPLKGEIRVSMIHSERFDPNPLDECKVASNLVEEVEVNAIAAKASDMRVELINPIAPELRFEVNELIDPGSCISVMSRSDAEKLKIELLDPVDKYNLVAYDGASAQRWKYTAPVDMILSWPNRNGKDDPERLVSKVKVRTQFEVVDKDLGGRVIIGRDVHVPLEKVLWKDPYLASSMAEPKYFQDKMKPEVTVLDPPGDCVLAALAAEELEEVEAMTLFPPEHESAVATSEHIDSTKADGKSYEAGRNDMTNNEVLVMKLKYNEEIVGFCTHDGSELKLDILPIEQWIHPVSGKRMPTYRKNYPIKENFPGSTAAKFEEEAKKGIIEPAPHDCPFNNPLVIAPKKDKDGRITGDRKCGDYRILNMFDRTQVHFELPRIRESLEALGKCCIFGEIDLKDAFSQLRLHPDSRPYTAVSFEDKRWMSVGCPFGLKVIPQHFQRVISEIMQGIANCFVYIDNIIFGSMTWDEHLQTLIEIVNRLNEKNLRIKPGSIHVGYPVLRVLGHQLSNFGLKVIPQHFQRVISEIMQGIARAWIN